MAKDLRGLFSPKSVTIIGASESPDKVGAIALKQSGSKIYSLLNGFRGDPPYSLDQLCETIIRLGKLAEGVTDIAEIEINPLIITHDGVWAVDCKVVFI